MNTLPFNRPMHLVDIIYPRSQSQSLLRCTFTPHICTWIHVKWKMNRIIFIRWLSAYCLAIYGEEKTNENSKAVVVFFPFAAY